MVLQTTSEISTLLFYFHLGKILGGKKFYDLKSPEMKGNMILSKKDLPPKWSGLNFFRDLTENF